MPGDTFENSKKIRKNFSLYFLVVVSITILFFGLNPRTLSFSNHVEWIENQSGIRFGKYGIAYTNSVNDDRGGISDSKTFSIEIALKLKKTNEEGYKFIFVLHNGRDSNQLLMGQYRSSIILMNGDDYAHKRNTKRITLDTALLPTSTFFLTITTNNHGTKLYFEDRLISEKKDLTLEFPNSGKVILVLGNSVYGNHFWQGDIYGLAFYQSTLTSRDVKIHFARWTKENNFSFAKIAQPFILFLFDEKESRWASDTSGGNHSLYIPKNIGTLERKFLVLPEKEIRFRMNSIADIFLNIVGFIPFGFLLSATLADLGGISRKYRGLITVGLCFMLSLVIEIIQAWLPFRSSSLSDLMFNVFGGWIGSQIYLSRCRHLYDQLIGTVSRQLLS